MESVKNTNGTLLNESEKNGKVKPYLWEKGVSANPNGRPKGAQNKITKTIKAVILDAFTELQKNHNTSLLGWAQNNLDDFYKHVAPKVIPLQISGDPDNPLLLAPATFAITPVLGALDEIETDEDGMNVIEEAEIIEDSDVDEMKEDSQQE